MGVYEFTEQELDARQAGLDVHLQEGIERDPRKIAARVAKRYGLTVAVLLGDSLAVHVTRARKVLYRELREVGLSYGAIGAFVGRDHTTIISGIKRGQP